MKYTWVLILSGLVVISSGCAINWVEKENLLGTWGAYCGMNTGCTLILMERGYYTLIISSMTDDWDEHYPYAWGVRVSGKYHIQKSKISFTPEKQDEWIKQNVKYSGQSEAFKNKLGLGFFWRESEDIDPRTDHIKGLHIIKVKPIFVLSKGDKINMEHKGVLYRFEKYSDYYLDYVFKDLKFIQQRDMNSKTDILPPTR